MTIWYGAQTQYNKEFAVRDRVALLGLGETFLPSYMVKYKSRNSRAKLLFHSYIFVALEDPVSWPRLANLDGVNRVLTYQPAAEDAYRDVLPIASNSIELLRAAALERDEEHHPNRDLIHPGCCVRIKSGPNKAFSIQKPIVEWTDTDRVGLVIYMFNRRSVVEFYLGDLELA